ncbi:MAG TPA: cytochrome C, partial [Syntrophobacteraceae bacterium]|nr:cytochrome C [Syntrophobacteraceae bacterium]
YRLSKGHSGVSCEACHGSTHAEWPVKPESGTAIANDNVAAMQLQGHTGKIIECAACHTSGSVPVTLNGPHGMHPVGDSRFISGHDNLFGANRAQCQACHGQTGQGTVLSKVAVNRTVGSRTFTKDEMIACTRCHDNPM